MVYSLPAHVRMIRQLQASLLSALLLCVSKGMGEVNRELIVSTHNDLRRAVVPPAADMQLVVWDDKLARLATQAARQNAQKCKMEHTYGGEYAGLGENIYKGTDKNEKQIVEKWFMERQIYTYENNTCSPNKELLSCDHYRQVVENSVTHVGCGRAVCPGRTTTIFTCEYNAGQGDQPYSSGEPCSKCNRKYRCNHGLCVNEARAASLPSVAFGSLPCKMRCLNCAVFLPDWCYCKCRRGTSGPFCEDINDGRNRSCAVCATSPERCKNDGQPYNVSSQCSTCICKNGFSGPRCEYSDAEILVGVNITLRGSSVFFNKVEAFTPVLNRDWQKISDAFEPLVKAAIEQRCGDKVQHIGNAEGFPVLKKNGDSSSVLIIRMSKSDSKCKTTENKYLHPSVLLEILNSLKTEIGEKLQTCCQLAVAGNFTRSSTKIIKDAKKGN